MEGEEIEINDPLSNFSLFNFIYKETIPADIESENTIYKNRKKRIYTFLSIPRNLESFICYGLLLCFDHFLWLYTFLPIRCLLFPLRFTKRLIFNQRRTLRQLLSREEIEDIVKMSFVIIPTFLLNYVDTKIIYHQIRSQSVIKLYIFFNLLEIVDRLVSPLSQDVMDALSWTVVKAEKQGWSWFHFIVQYVFASFCFIGHLFVMIFQTTILNVAFNSHNNAILTVMLSNNFIEMKGNVFRKVEKTNLFQMSCADSRERFHYLVMLSLVVFRNSLEIGWNGDEMYSMFINFMSILIAEILVDWVKHAFITKFNFISADVYKEFSVSLAYDFLLCHEGKNSSSYFELFGRRMGLTSIPLICLTNVFLIQSAGKYINKWWIAIVFSVLFLVKILMKLWLLSKSYKEVCRYIESSKILADSSTRIELTDCKGDKVTSIKHLANENELFLPPLTIGSKFDSRLKRTLSFTEGVIDDKLSNDSDSKSTRSHRSSLVNPPVSGIDFSNSVCSTPIISTRNPSNSSSLVTTRNIPSIRSVNVSSDQSIDNISPVSSEQSPSANNITSDGGGGIVISRRHRTFSSVMEDELLQSSANSSISQSSVKNNSNYSFVDNSFTNEIANSSISSNSTMNNSGFSNNNVIINKSTEPVVHYPDTAEGITDNVYEGSKTAQTIASTNNTSSTSDHNQSNSSTSSHRPLCDVNRFSMYTNQIV